MRIISLSVDGIVQAAKRGLFDWLEQQDADVICLQDLRAREDQLDAPVYFPDGYYAYFCDTADGINGVAIYTRQLPRAIMVGFGYSPDVDLEGAYIRADFEQLSVVSLLCPHASVEPQSLENKMRFFDHLKDHLQKVINKRRKFIFCGNWHIAHQKADVQNWEAHQATPGFLPFERQWINEVFNDLGYVDALRTVSSDRDLYSWWPSGSVDQGDGWRVDAQVISPEFASSVQEARFFKGKAFSSHLPLIVDYDIECH
ncbi:MAG TPA: exodeoxyribonuclease III [Pseudomonadales bacterium]|nr:exodeoxyribonuclease III [Pseudomonadales bacterium]